MVQRRDVLKLGLAAGGSRLLAAAAPRDPRELLKFLCPPDGEPPDLVKPSPPATPFKAPLFVPPVMQPVAQLDPPPDPRAHQLYEQYPPQKLYELHEQEFRWKYHPDPPYSNDGGSWSWGYNGSTPGPIFQARYGEPILVRRFNNLPPVGVSNVTFALPSTSSHLHNSHTASESDGSPQDWIDTGEFWDHHYANFPAGHDPRQKLSSLWYHDHRLDFTAANVYAGLTGFYSLFDQDGEDTGDENTGWRLPSGQYDVPLILHDVMFQENGQVRWNPFNTAGILGDRYTVNRRIQPFFQVERRKYRFRIYNGGPSRFYQLFLSSGKPFVVITGDGNFLPEPLLAESLFLSVAQRVDIIVDFSEYNVGQTVELVNRLEQLSGQGPSGPLLDPGDPVMQFQVVAATGKDNSRIPDKFRPLPKFDPRSAVRERTWTFDYFGGLWTINGKVMDPNRIDAGVEIGTTEIWTFRNGGNNWSHPIHCHFVEFIILEVNGKPYEYSFVQDWEDGEEKLVPYLGIAKPWRQRDPIDRFMGGPRRDIATLLPGDEIKTIFTFPDFLGHYVMHCHNVVHEDHSMMLRWDILEPGQGFGGSRPASVVYGTETAPPHLEPRPRASTFQQDQQEPREE